MIIKTCLGCATGSCIISHNSIRKARECPCIDCIVKPACMEQCDKFRELLERMYPKMEAWRRNYKAHRIKKVFFPCGNPDLSDHTIRKGYLGAGSMDIDLKENRPDVNNKTICRPTGCSFNSVYFEEDQIIYINK